jgi:hypothetical protein
LQAPASPSDGKPEPEPTPKFTDSYRPMDPDDLAATIVGDRYDCLVVRYAGG